MNLSEPFVRRPIMTVLLMSGLVVFGLLAYRWLPVAALPSVDFPTIQVSASLPGASPETMAAAVATPLEKQFSNISGIDSMNSTSAQGSTQITLQFALDRDIDAAAQDVQSAISQAARQLPSDMPTPPSFRKLNPAAFAVFYLALSSKTLPLATVNEYAETLIAQRMSMISGVAEVNVYGSQKHAVRVQLDPRALAARGIGIDEVEQAVASHNVNLPTGSLSGHEQTTVIEATGQLFDTADYRSLIVAYRNGAPVRLGELGRVIDSVQTDKVAAWYNGERGIVLAVHRQANTNTIEVVNAVRKLLPTFRAQIPAGINMDILYDRSVSIRQSVGEVQFALLLAFALVVMVIFLFLRRATATLIPTLALPTSIIGTFCVMYLLGYSIDNLSLMALTLCVGFVVDDAIVMLENVTRHIETGEPPLQATLNGSREISFTIVSMTLSLAVVFVPVLFMGGILGRLLHEFAVTIMAAVLISGLVSLTLTPMLCSRVLKPVSSERHGRLFAASEVVFDAIRNGYDASLSWTLRHPRLTMAVFAIIVAATVHLFLQIPKGFLPSEDTGQLFAFTETSQDISFDAMAREQQRVAKVVRDDPNVAASMSFIGAGGSSQALNTGRIFISLKPLGERVGADQVIQELRAKLSAFPGIKVYLHNIPIIRIGGHLTKSQYQYTLQDADSAELLHWAPIIVEKLRTVPGLRDVTSDLQIDMPRVTIKIDRDHADALGVTPEKIENALADAYGSRQVSTIYASSNEYWVILELRPEFQRDRSALSLLYVRSANGALVPLDAVARQVRSVGPLTVTHLGQLPSTTVSFDLDEGVSLGEAIARIGAALAGIGVPQTLAASYQGTAQAFQSSFQGMGFLLLMSVLVIYLVLGILYESFVHPITILSGLPTAGFGALVTLMAFHRELDMYGFVGMIMLVGIVKKNAIIMIDFAIEAERREGMAPMDAIYRACLVRFRPIMMTTMAALMGTLPIAIGLGAGGGRQSLGLAVVGGLIFSQFLTLYITPVIYLYLEAFKRRIARGRIPLRRGSLST